MKNQTKIKLKKAFNISFEGKPKRSIQSVEPSPMVGVIPDQFKFMKAKVIVNLNDQVKRGQALFYDKKIPKFTFIRRYLEPLHPFSMGINGGWNALKFSQVTRMMPLNFNLLMSRHYRLVTLNQYCLNEAFGHRLLKCHFITCQIQTQPHQQSLLCYQTQNRFIPNYPWQ